MAGGVGACGRRQNSLSGIGSAQLEVRLCEDHKPSDQVQKEIPASFCHGQGELCAVPSGRQHTAG